MTMGGRMSREYEHRDMSNLGAYADKDGNVNIRNMLSDTIAVAKIAEIDKEVFFKEANALWDSLFINPPMPKEPTTGDVGRA